MLCFLLAQDRVVVTGQLQVGASRTVSGVGRLTTSGQFDRTFAGGRGFLPIIYDQSQVSATLDPTGSCVGIGPDGKIVVSSNVFFQDATASSVGLSRFTSEGVLDPSFGGSGQFVLKTGSGTIWRHLALPTFLTASLWFRWGCGISVRS
jgi:hypothetical protein